jgi:hypothetical protein
VSAHMAQAIRNFFREQRPPQVRSSTSLPR